MLRISKYKSSKKKYIRHDQYWQKAYTKFFCSIKWHTKDLEM